MQSMGIFQKAMFYPQTRTRSTLSVIIFLMLLSVGLPANAQVIDRSIDEIKHESIDRVKRGAYPLGGLNQSDVEEAFSKITTRDPDDWANGFGSVADKYMAIAASAKTKKEAGAAYKRAWRLYYFGQFPVPNSPGKKASYDKAINAYIQYLNTQDTPTEVVKIPFEGKFITGYLRFPKNAKGPVPMILAINGLDSRKETVAESYTEILDQGVGFLAIDGPGTGQAPIKVDNKADRMFSTAIDYLYKHPKVDNKRIIAFGVSFGAHWSAKLGITEKDRLLGVVAQSPAVDVTFSEAVITSKVNGNKEYLFDYIPATLYVYEGANTVDDLYRLVPEMSLKKQGLLGKPTTRMLVVAGAKDTQTPIQDAELLLRSGDIPKEAWVNPRGGHLGRESTGWIDPVIFSKVIIPWELKLIKESRNQ
jgi:pimeloyl-ACP methyl ester carboxylesterase